MAASASASSRLLRLGTALFLSRSPSPPFAPVLFFKPLPSRLPLRCLSSSSSSALATVAADSTEAPASHYHHPWPEWLNFLDTLKTKGYLKSPQNQNDASEVDYHLLKEACLTFARDRYDVFQSLSTKEIRTLVESGCPDRFRKAINSAKRLRAYVQLEEADVCGACDVRSSCDRALLVNQGDTEARTLDVVRLLLSYALDPRSALGGEKPPRRELVESSARKLLSELIELSETPLDPTVPKPASVAPVQKKETTNANRDWVCLRCNFLNFERNIQCLKCKADGPTKLGVKEGRPTESIGVNNVEMKKKGDWHCLQCNFMNFARNIDCRNCKAERPKRVGALDVAMKPGDWNCPQCNFMNFARNMDCRSCEAERPKRVGAPDVAMKPGDWNCPRCDFLNFKRNEVCLKCSTDRPPMTTESDYGNEVANAYEDRIWKRPK